MKLLTALILLFACVKSHSQNLDNTEWIQIKTLDKDGNEINLNRNEPLKFYFKSDSLFRSTNEQYSYRESYEIHNHILSIGNSTKFKIDSSSDEILVISDISNIYSSKGKISTRILFNADYIFDFLRKSNLLNTTTDSIIQSDNYISPTFDGDFNNFFMSKFDFNVQKEELFCSFEVLHDGNISNIQIKSNQKLSSKESDRIKKIIASTKDYWIIPPVPNGYRFNLNFAANISRSVNISGSYTGSEYIFTFHADSLNYGDISVLSPSDVAKENDNFDYGVRLMQKEKYEKAIEQFKKCLKTNPSDIDVLYNIAHCYQKKGNIELACEAWKKLKKMGQKDGENLYNQNCNSNQ
ncbi:MAG TPA: tetratricopeptide repeat protein [Ginsengibacter sp.]